MEKMTSVTIDQNKIISSVQKLSPKPGDLLMFYVKTDKDGMMIVDPETVQQTSHMIGETLKDRGVSGIFLTDTIYLFSIDDAERSIETLENCISSIREAIDKAPDIKNGKFREPVRINLEDAAQDQFKRVL